jgi:DNA repair photolyase
MDWVLERMEEGYVDVVNPFNRKQVNRISLNPTDVKCFVWWSKNFEEWIKTFETHKDLFNSYKGHSFQFTINSPSELEKNIKISLNKRFNQLEWLIENFGITAVNYRYDPIIFYKDKGSNQIKNNLGKFRSIIERVAKLGLKEVIFSFATIYPKVNNRMNMRGYTPINLTIKKKIEILEKLMNISQNYHLQMKACCQPDLLEIPGIDQAHCIDAYKIEEIVGENIPKQKDTGQRKDCGCFKSRDIGGYSGIFRCRHNCDYCYASPAKQ